MNYDTIRQHSGLHKVRIFFEDECATSDPISLSSNGISSSYQNGVEVEVVGLRPAGCVNPYFMDAKVVSNSIIIHNLSLSLSPETIT